MQSELTKRLHIAVIMDGNGRWATQRGLPRVAGHRAGVAAVRRVVEHAPSLGIRCLTLYAFSSDNWSRPPAEVQSLMWLLRAFFRLEKKRLKEHGVRLEVIGRRDRLPKPLLRELSHAEATTAGGSNLHLRVAVDYSARDAISRSVVDISTHTTQDQALSPEHVGSMLKQALAGESGEVDLLIRTGGEKRLSDFLLWESAYAELLFTDRMWPDFDEADLEAAVKEFHHRERRFGGLPNATATAIAS